MKVIPIRPGVRIMAKSGHGEFFAVGRESFIKACDLGMNTAVTFLVQACGTGPAQKNTRWSATAVEKYSGMGWNRANDAVQSLIKHKVEKRTDDKKHAKKRQYELQVKGDLIWLPKTIIMGAGSEVPPIKKLRQTQHVMTLRLFVELYHAHNLRDDGGISRGVTCKTYERKEYGGRAEYTVWAFESAGNQSMRWCDLTEPHRRSELTPVEEKASSGEGVDFFARWKTLESLRLVEWLPYLFEGKDGEPLHPLNDTDLCDAMSDAAHSLLSQGQSDADCSDYLIPVYHHMQAVQVYGIGRLQYRPHTRATSAGWANYQQQRREYLQHYQAISSRHITAEAV
jgi:hypothetical protein